MPAPLVGHCMASLKSSEFLVAGGYSATKHDYIDTLYIFNIEEQYWSSKAWMKLKHGPRIDASCSAVTWGLDRTVITAGVYQK